MDEFIGLWALEMKRDVPNKSQRVNLAPKDDVDVAAVRSVILARPQLFAFDMLLHEISKERFVDYRKQMSERSLSWSYPDNSRRAFSLQQNGIWLTENWYDPEVRENDLAWWSGPTAVSEVRFRRNQEHAFLLFDIEVVNGITYDDIIVRRKDKGLDMDVIRFERSENISTYCVPLHECGDEGGVLLIVPNCFATIMLSGKTPT